MLKKIGTKVLLVILPIMIVAMGLLTTISAETSKDLIHTQVDEKMQQSLNANQASIIGELDKVKTMATTLSRSVAHTYETTDLQELEEVLGNLIWDNDMVLGSGLWFEPYAFDREKKYVGPYVYKNGDEVELTFDYCTDEYDYVSQEYYTNAKNSDVAVITDPYFDPTSGIVMSSCSAPIKHKGKYIGCVTVDIELTTIQEIVDNIKVGEQGFAMLTDSQGTYLAGMTDEKIQNGVKVTEDENPQIAALGKEILEKRNGVTTFKDVGETYNVYYNALDGVDWELIIVMPQSELEAPVHKLILVAMLVCIIIVVLAAVIITFFVKSLTKNIGKVQKFVGHLADGDFTVPAIAVKSQDEIGNMSQSLNEMYEKNKGIISNIAERVKQLDDASVKLSDASANLKEQFTQIDDNISHVNEAMMTSSAATEEVNASTEEVEAAVNILTEETAKSMNMVQEIRKRADEIGENSQKSFEKASVLSNQFEEQLNTSIEKAKVVQEIGQMANVISDIAEQINLLALNASIEAARAGEAGRGFSVVATEIGNLANETESAVGNIQETVKKVQEAFSGLSGDAEGLLEFISETVTPDYNNFVQVASQYGNDANAFADSSEKISGMSDNIRDTMAEVSKAVQDIAESAQSTSDISGDIMNSVNQVAGVVVQVSDMSGEQRDVANELKDVVDNFKL